MVGGITGEGGGGPRGEEPLVRQEGGGQLHHWTEGRVAEQEGENVGATRLSQVLSVRPVHGGFAALENPR